MATPENFGDFVPKEQFIAVESQLKAVQELFNKLFENLGDEVHLWKLVRDSDGSIKTWELADVNPTAIKAWKKSRKDVIGKTANEIFEFDATRQFKDRLTQMIESGNPFKWVEYFEPTGQYLSMTSIPIGEYFISTGEDITQRMKAEQELKVSEQKYRNIAENFPGIVLRYVLKPDGSDGLLYISKGVQDLYEVSKDDAVANNKLLWDRVHKDDVDAYLKSVKTSAQNLSMWELEHRLQFPDGRVKWVYTSGVPFKQDDGSIVWDTFGIDITESVQAKMALETLNNTLEKRVEERTQELVKMSEELELYRLAAEHSESGVWYFDLENNQLQWDDIMYNLYGIEKNSFSGAYEAWESSLHPEDKERCISELNEAIEGINPFDTVFRIINHVSGEVRYIRGKGKIERNDDGKAIAVYGTNWDVTREMKLSFEREEALENLKETQAQLIQSEKMASIGVLTTGIAHEINNPLNFILGGYTTITNYINENEQLNKEELIEYLNWIKTGADRTASIVKSLNLFSLDSDRMDEQCDLNQIIENCLDVLEPAILPKIKVSKIFYSEECMVTGNVGNLHQVMLNILSNAIDAIQRNGEIGVSTASIDGHVEVIVTDNGCGIGQEHLDKIMDPFYTTKSPGRGTGMGLAITKSIISQHGGELRIESEQDMGTKVTIHLPKRR
jgi:PAS domain S-box-containing protein